MIYVVSASTNQLPNKAIRSILKLSMKVFITILKNVIIRQHKKLIHVAEGEVV